MRPRPHVNCKGLVNTNCPFKLFKDDVLFANAFQWRIPIPIWGLLQIYAQPTFHDCPILGGNKAVAYRTAHP